MEARAVYLDVGKITIDTVALPTLGPNDVLVKTHQASVCGPERYRGVNVRPQDEARGSAAAGHPIGVGRHGEDLALRCTTCLGRHHNWADERYGAAHFGTAALCLRRRRPGIGRAYMDGRARQEAPWTGGRHA